MREQLVTSAAQTYGGVSKCTSITVHETANQSVGADAQAHANLQSNGNVRQASWHIQVDDTAAIRSYPDTAQCWHAGPAAADSIAVEICVNADGDYEAAFTRAAAVVAGLRAKHGIPRSKVYDHAHWTGKNCPSVMRAAGRWQEFLNLTEGATSVSTMISPFEGRLTQNHGDGGGYRGHKGMDIAPPKPGQTGMPVYAAFAGWITRMERKSKPGNKASTWAPGRTGDGMAVRNKDGEGNGYNHMYPLAGLEIGDWVNAGDLIGHNNLTGNMSGAHLHFELWADCRDPNSDYDPQLAFRKFKVTPGSKPSKTVAPVASKPKPKPTAKPATPAKGSNSKSDNEAIQKALTNMGLNVGFPDGVNGKGQKAGVLAFQKQHGLVEDEHWGPVVQAKFDENKRLQTALNKMKSSTPKLTVDGWLGNPTNKRKADVLKRNGWTNANLIANLKKVKAW